MTAPHTMSREEPTAERLILIGKVMDVLGFHDGMHLLEDDRKKQLDDILHLLDTYTEQREREARIDETNWYKSRAMNVSGVDEPVIFADTTDLRLKELEQEKADE